MNKYEILEEDKDKDLEVNTKARKHNQYMFKEACRNMIKI